MGIQGELRVSTLLRTLFTDKGKPFDTDAAEMERRRVIAARQRAANAAANSASRASEGVLNWAGFAADVHSGVDGYAEHKRGLTRFLARVASVVGEDRPDAEVQAYAQHVFDLCVAAPTAHVDATLRERVTHDVGAVAPGVLDELLRTAQELHVWRKASSTVRCDGPGAALAMAREAGRMAAPFGAALAGELGDVGGLAPVSEAEVLALPDMAQLRNVARQRAEARVREREAAARREAEAVARAAEQRERDAQFSPTYTMQWLTEQCGGSDAGGAAHDMAFSVVYMLQSDSSDMELQAQLFDLLGSERVGVIADVLAHRAEILQDSYRLFSESAHGPGFGANAPPQPRRPAYGAQVTVQTASEKRYLKQKRKEEKRARRRGEEMSQLARAQMEWMQASGGFDAVAMREQRRRDLDEATARQYNVYDAGSMNLKPASMGGGGVGGGSGRASRLPEGTTRKMHKGYEEVAVPAQKPPPLNTNEQLVAITEFDAFAQLAFKGYKSLNRIQSRLFPAAYHSNENLLVCAPTGAGKTNVAMMCILHEVGQHIHRGVIRKDEFKIVYVAPMKALAAEMTESFGKRLRPLGIKVRELTGDMQLSKREIIETQMIVTTPEKYDVITRKSSDNSLAALVRLLIIDEVHLLNDERGSVIESLVARTLRQVENSQTMIRIVGLSATLPNYRDVAVFLRVNVSTGLFYFDNRYRPVPLAQTYIGVSEKNPMRRVQVMNEIAFDKAVHALRNGKQMMVFVHSRKDTAKTARALLELAGRRKETALFSTETHPMFGARQRDVNKSSNNELKELYRGGFGMHHAGMLRKDRTLTEKLFGEGLIKVLCTTATLAWGVNLPAHTVVIKGTQIYNAEKGAFVELGILDVMQIFGRAGRPQFDTTGHGIIITAHDQLQRYLQLMNHQLPIESQFIKRLADHLNAEITLGTVSNVKEGAIWLSYTYLFIRMMRNPMVYGIPYEEKESDPQLVQRRHDLITSAARELYRCKMIRFDERTGALSVTDLGRVASHYYIQHASIDEFNTHLKSQMGDEDLLGLLSKSAEFSNIKVRDEELDELENLQKKACPVAVRGGMENQHGKINILLQTFISNNRVRGFALVSDTAYITQSAARLLRGLFEISMKRGWSLLAESFLSYCKMVDRQMWYFQHPLRQFRMIPWDIIRKLEERNCDLDRLYDMDASEIGAFLRNNRMGATVAKYVAQFPALDLDASIQPITRTVLRITLHVTPAFEWNDRVHGGSEPWWIWVEDHNNEHIYHSEYFLLNRKNYGETTTLAFTIPIFEPLPPQYYVRAVSDRWIGAETVLEISFANLVLPHKGPAHTELLDLNPLPVGALKNVRYESLFKFTHFNPIQTQLFHTAYHTDVNMLVGAPTGSGKTATAELAILGLFNRAPKAKVIYIAPLKALSRERMKDWKPRFAKIGRSMVELTGDSTPDMWALRNADIIATTPEKWDGITRHWKQRGYVKAVGLVVIDEIHLLGEDRGPILEVIVSRMRYISSQTEQHVRFVGLSTALANAHDVGDWLGIENVGLYNFRPSVRPCPIESHVQGYPGRHYCPRMNSMNKPTYAAIKQHSPLSPVLVFVSSRRQTRLTALDLLQLAAGDEQPKQFVHMPEDELEMVLVGVKDTNLRHTLAFGVGIHHAGLAPNDRSIVEELFRNNKIQVLVSTSTLAWGVNLPAHLVVVKGTEYFDAKKCGYVDFPITDVLQMIGRAGRPQFDTCGKAVILVHLPKKNFYKKFLYEPFPVESHLHEVLHDHINAEIVEGTITCKQDAVDWLTWTYYYRRLLMNPSYYQLDGTGDDDVNAHLSRLVSGVLEDLEYAGCITQELDDEWTVYANTPGMIASYYYLSYRTLAAFTADLHGECTMEDVLRVLCGAHEYSELPVRHNEDKLNAELAADVPLEVDERTLDSSHTKAHLLLQAHLSRVPLPISDFYTDTKSVLDQAIRILQAMVDVSADGGWLQTTLWCMHVMQQLVQGRWLSDSTLLQLPHVDEDDVAALARVGVHCLPQFLRADVARMEHALAARHSAKHLRDIGRVANHFPLVDVSWRWRAEVVAAEAETVLDVELERVNGGKKRRAYAPRWPKQKDENWWLVLGDEASGELIALKRIVVTTRTRTQLTFAAPATEGLFTYTLYLISDSYLGLDQVRTVDVLVSASANARDGTEDGDGESDGDGE